MPRFLIDEDLPRSLSILLQQNGLASEHVSDLGFRGASDSRIFALSRERRAVLVSRDVGFANVLQYPLGSHHGIVVVRFPSEMPMRALVTTIVEWLATIQDPEFEGSLIILEPGRTRIRRRG